MEGAKATVAGAKAMVAAAMATVAAARETVVVERETGAVVTARAAAARETVVAAKATVAAAWAAAERARAAAARETVEGAKATVAAAWAAAERGPAEAARGERVARWVARGGQACGARAEVATATVARVLVVAVRGKGAVVTARVAEETESAMVATVVAAVSWEGVSAGVAAAARRGLGVDRARAASWPPWKRASWRCQPRPN